MIHDCILIIAAVQGSIDLRKKIANEIDRRTTGQRPSAPGDPLETVHGPAHLPHVPGDLEGIDNRKKKSICNDQSFLGSNTKMMKAVCPIFHDAPPDPIDLIRSSNHVSNTRNLKMGNVNPESNSSM
jgi:hypothetical protein